MRYVSAIVNETIRLHPPVWLIVRDVRVAMEVGGWDLRPGDRLMICPRLLHRDPRWWPEPELFDPDRWLGADSPAAPFTYLPFGAGARACLGTRLATAQLRASLDYLWRHVEFDLEAPEDVREAPGALLVPVHGHARCWWRESPGTMER